MKIKQSFVTNSSTACFIVVGDDDITESINKHCHENNNDGYYPDFILFKNIGQLKYYVQYGRLIDEESSWIDEMMGIKYFSYMDEDNYEICKDNIKQKKYVLMVKIDNCANINELCEFIENKNHKIIMMDEL